MPDPSFCFLQPGLYANQSAETVGTREVNMLEPMHFVTETGTSYASVIEETQSLYLLSFLLTADHDKAEQCLVSAIEECAEGIGFFMDWARLWIRRAVLKHAIQLIMPAPEHADDGTRISLKKPAMWADNIPFARVLLLDAFERFFSSCRFWKGSPTRNVRFFSDAPGTMS
jgi:hypothetical protein